MEWSSLLVLICPLMMIVMMMGGKGRHGGHGRVHEHGHGSQAGQPQPDLKLREEMNQLKAQNEQMQRELKQLSQRV